MRRDEVISQIQVLFSGACVELFGSLNCDVIATDALGVSFEEVPVACVDAGSEDIEFLIALQLPLSVLAMTYPVMEGITLVEEDRLEDWISELSNQLSGRLKRKLAQHDCHVKLGLPATYFGSEIEELLVANHERTTYFFDLDGEMCACTIALEVYNEAQSYSLEKVEDDDQGASEGELELF